MTGVYIRKNENGEETHNFDFYTDLSASNKIKFVESVVSTIVSDKQYNSIIKDLIFDYYVVKIFTFIDTSELEESYSFVDDVEKFLEETNIVDVVKANAAPTLFEELDKAVNKSIEYLTGIHPNILNESLSSLVKTLENKINGIDLDSMANMAKIFTEITDEFTTDNIVNAYIKSDIHKDNLSEIEESKKKMTEFAEDLDKAINIVGNNISSKKSKK